MRIHLRIACLIAFGLVALVMLAACSGSKASGPKLRADITYEAIAGALFDTGDLPPDLAHLLPDEDNPFRNAEEDVVEGSWDVEEDKRDLETFGWEAEWSAQFSAQPESNEIFIVVSDAALYKTPGGAHGELQDQLVEAADQTGRTNADGTTLVAAREFGVDGLGEQAIGLRYTLINEGDSGDTEIYANVVAFRVDRLIGMVALGSIQQEDMRAMALTLAAVLAEKFESLLQA